MNSLKAQIYFDHLRRKSQIFRNFLLKQIRIQQIRDYIAAGGDPATNPEYASDYAILMAESNGLYFVFEDGKGNLVKEEDKL